MRRNKTYLIFRADNFFPIYAKNCYQVLKRNLALFLTLCNFHKIFLKVYTEKSSIFSEF